jgi:hypothetical protein
MFQQQHHHHHHHSFPMSMPPVPIVPAAFMGNFPMSSNPYLNSLPRPPPPPPPNAFFPPAPPHLASMPITHVCGVNPLQQQQQQQSYVIGGMPPYPMNLASSNAPVLLQSAADSSQPYNTFAACASTPIKHVEFGDSYHVVPGGAMSDIDSNGADMDLIDDLAAAIAADAALPDVSMDSDDRPPSLSSMPLPRGVAACWSTTALDGAMLCRSGSGSHGSLMDGLLPKSPIIDTSNIRSPVAQHQHHQRTTTAPFDSMRNLFPEYQTSSSSSSTGISVTDSN